MNIGGVLVVLLHVYYVKPVAPHETNNEVCNGNADDNNIQCALQNMQFKLEAYVLTVCDLYETLRENIQHKLNTQAITMRDIRETQLFQSTRDCSDLYDRG